MRLGRHRFDLDPNRVQCRRVSFLASNIIIAISGLHVTAFLHRREDRSHRNDWIMSPTKPYFYLYIYPQKRLSQRLLIFPEHDFKISIQCITHTKLRCTALNIGMDRSIEGLCHGSG